MDERESHKMSNDAGAAKNKQQLRFYHPNGKFNGINARCCVCRIIIIIFHKHKQMRNDGFPIKLIAIQLFILIIIINIDFVELHICNA